MPNYAKSIWNLSNVCKIWKVKNNISLAMTHKPKCIVAKYSITWHFIFCSNIYIVQQQTVNQKCFFFTWITICWLKERTVLCLMESRWNFRLLFCKQQSLRVSLLGLFLQKLFDQLKKFCSEILRCLKLENRTSVFLKTEYLRQFRKHFLQFFRSIIVFRFFWNEKW